MAKIVVFKGNQDNKTYKLSHVHLEYFALVCEIEVFSTDFMDDRTNLLLIECIEAVRENAGSFCDVSDYNWEHTLDPKIEAVNHFKTLFRKLELELSGLQITPAWNACRKHDNAYAVFCRLLCIPDMPSIHELFEKLLEADKKIDEAEIECTRKVDSAIMFDKDHCIEIGTNGKSVFNDGFEIVEYDERMFSAEIKVVDGIETVVFNRNVNRETIEKLVQENDVDGVISYIQELFKPID